MALHSVCSWIIVTLLAAPAWALPTQRILLLGDRLQTSHELAVVHEAMLQELFNDPDVQLLAPGVLPARTTRGAELRRAGCAELAQARRELARRKLDAAHTIANCAAQKLWRAASLTGEVSPWMQARAVQAAVYAAEGRVATAQRLFGEVFAMDQSFEDAALRRNASQVAVSRARRGVGAAARVPVQVRAQPSDAALWIDGQFVGYAEASMQLPAGSKHVVMATAPGHEARAQVVTAEKSAGAVLLHLVADPANATAPYDALVASTRIAKAFPDPNNPLFDALDPTSVWVLRYDQGGVHLAAFDLTTGRRHDIAAPATVLSLGDARDVARALAVQPPAVPALERPPTT